MPPTLRHALYPRGRLLRLLDDLDRAAPASAAETVAYAPGEVPASLSGLLPAEVDAALAETAARSPTGAVLFAAAGQAWLVSPPFPIAQGFRGPGYQTARLRALVMRRYRIAAVLLRLGGWAAGIYDGDALVAARNGGRFVKNRHRKGGQSQRRFERIREKQIDQLFAQLCIAVERLLAEAGELDWLFLGGDRHTMQAFRKGCHAIEATKIPLSPRFLDVPEPRHETLERLPHLLYAGRVTFWTNGIAADSA